VTLRTYRRLLAEAAGVTLRTAGGAVAEHLDTALHDELEGMAAGAGVDLRELLAVNARTELLAGTTACECSVVGHIDGAWVRLAQTWDWHPDLAPARVLWTVAPPGGAWFTTATEAGIVAKLGVNSRGVACALNFLRCSADGGTHGVPIHVLLRLVLERAGSGADAMALLLRARTSASSAITVASASGGDAALCCVERSPGGGTVVWPDPDGWLVHTNHFLAPPACGVDLEPAVGPGSALRRERLAALVRGGVAPEAALASHEPAEQPLCRHGDDDDAAWPDRRATLLALAIDPRARSLRVAAGPPCRAPFEPVASP
jgi:isopenicillin-N N-acyltransferase-like protein